MREFFFALNKNTTTTQQRPPDTSFFVFFVARSRIFLLTNHKDSFTRQSLDTTYTPNFIRRKQRPLQRKTPKKIQKKQKFVVKRREIFPAPSSSSSSSSSSNVAAAGAKRKEEKEREIYHLCFVSSIRSRATNTHQRQRALTIQRQQINNNKT